MNGKYIVINEEVLLFMSENKILSVAFICERNFRKVFFKGFLFEVGLILFIIYIIDIIEVCAL